MKNNENWMSKTKSWINQNENNTDFVTVWSDELLVEFFEFYSEFDFAKHGISIITGSVMEKPDQSAPIYIENPLECELNVSKMVREEDLGLLVTQCLLARDALGQCSMVPRSRHRGDLWGLLSILKTDDQLQLTDDLPEDTQQTVAAEANDNSADSNNNSVNTEIEGAQSPPSLDIHEILRDDKRGDAACNAVAADNFSSRRTL